jgi:hypothetical protein
MNMERGEGKPKKEKNIYTQGRKQKCELRKATTLLALGLIFNQVPIVKSRFEPYEKDSDLSTSNM